MDVAVIGLGKLGSPMAAIFASLGHNTIGVDMVPATVEKINRLEPPVFEPGLKELLLQTGGRLRATSNLAEAVQNSRISFVIVPTPSEKNGSFSMKYAEAAAREIGFALLGRTDPHLVVLTSTVMPGDTDAVFIKALESASGQKVGSNIGVCYSPEFIALGTCIRDFLHPDLVLIGESDSASGKLLADFYQTLHQSNPGISRMAIVNAEITKISLNSFVTMKISFANMIASICENFPEGNVDDVTKALGHDSRIGAKYFRGSVSFGGPCFPRDNRALARLGMDLGKEMALPEATDKINNSQLDRVLTIINNLDPRGLTVGILGLAYKPGTNVVEKSFGIALADALAERGLPVIAHDFHARIPAVMSMNQDIEFTDSVEECCKRSDIIIVALPCAEYGNLPREVLCESKRPKVILDCWRLNKLSDFADVAKVIALGTGDVQKVANKSFSPPLVQPFKVS